MGQAAQARRELRAGLRALFNAPVALALDDPRAAADGMLPAEWAAVEHAVEARRREFAAGRRAARAAMAELGRPASALPVADDRAPIWPEGLVGTISHTSELCVAVVTQVGAVESLGIDIEPAHAVEADLVPQVCTFAERAWLQSQPHGARNWLATLLFSAKEAAYKCQYPLTRKVFDFQALEITPDLDLGVIEARFTQAVEPFDAGDMLRGRFLMGEGVVATGFEHSTD